MILVWEITVRQTFSSGSFTRALVGIPSWLWMYQPTHCWLTQLVLKGKLESDGLLSLFNSVCVCVLYHLFLHEVAISKTMAIKPVLAGTVLSTHNHHLLETFSGPTPNWPHVLACYISFSVIHSKAFEIGLLTFYSTDPLFVLFVFVFFQIGTHQVAQAGLGFPSLVSDVQVLGLQVCGTIPASTSLLWPVMPRKFLQAGSDSSPLTFQAGPCCKEHS